MRALFWILLLGNVILFAVIERGGGWGWGEQAYQPQSPLHEEKIRLLDANQSPPASQSLPVKAIPGSASSVVPVGALGQLAASAPIANHDPAASSAQAANPERAASQVPAAKPAPVADKQHALICLEWGEFSGADLKRATDTLSTLHVSDNLSQRQIEFDKGYWVYIPPLKNKAAVNRKISQLKVRRVNEYFIVWDKGPLQFAISLGVFKTQDAAQNYLKELRAKDVRTAQVGERASKLKTTMFMLNSVDASIEAKLAATKKDFPESELKKIPCALTR